jgi:nucleotide-binding universal stress UspA family protein
MERIFRRVLVPIDGSSYSIEAGKFGIRLAKSYELELVALHVIDEAALEQLSRLGQREQKEFREELRRRGENYLSHLAELAQREGVKLQKLLEEGTPHRAIVRAAEREGVDLILMGKVGRRGPRRILIGSVTERVLAAAKCPVLVMRAD